MAHAHQKTSRAAERRKQRRQRRGQSGKAPERASRAPRMAPLSMDPRKESKPTPATSTIRLDETEEYVFVRRDLWRLTIYSVMCFVLMIGVLFWLNA